MLRITVSILAATVLLAACTLIDQDLEVQGDTTKVTTLTDAQKASFVRSYMTSFDVANGGAVSSAKGLTPFGIAQSTSSRATVPIFGTQSYDLPTGATSVTGTKVDYPEPGQTSSWTVKPYSTNVYRVDVTTTFPSDDLRLKQEEQYLLLDNVPLGTWTIDDEIVNNLGTKDSTYRLLNRLYYRDGSYQDEKIVKTIPSGTNGYKAWSVDGSLDYPIAFVPSTEAGTSWSSVVVYTRKYADAPSYSFWEGHRATTLVGIRYYTEKLNADSTRLEASMISFEKAVTSLTTSGSAFTDYFSALFLPSIWIGDTQAVLAQSVLRQSVSYGWNDNDKVVNYSDAMRTTKMRTVVADIYDSADFYIQRVNSDADQLVNLDGSIWIPSGDATEVISYDPSAQVNVKETNQITSTDGSALNVTSNAPSGDLGTLYVSLDNKAVSIGVTGGSANDIPGDLSGAGTIESFTGGQGTPLPVPTPANLYDSPLKGTVEAWIYVYGKTNTPGIVHAGQKPDFSDEIWSLQFMGSTNLLSFSLSEQSPYGYDFIQANSSINLKRWYYVVATWDVAGNSMKLYLNGNQIKSGGFNKVTTSSTFAPDVPGYTGSPIIVGSQFYDATQVLSGYYGFNGKINGVLIHPGEVKSAADILAFYNANKARTAYW